MRETQRSQEDCPTHMVGEKLEKSWKAKENIRPKSSDDFLLKLE